jgi:predicted glycoside hydrolase/deacetylase ChbG (UPF0249 family)
MPNPMLEKLGFLPDARLVILHVDDCGMCHSANTAYRQIVEYGIFRCGAVMVPCPWFNNLANYCSDHPEVDMGVHITLNCEYEDYRWTPLSTLDPASGLLDEDGYLWKTVEELHAHMDPDAALIEIEAQISRALEAGIDVTHIDTQMGAVLHADLAPGYIQLAMKYRIPAMIPRMTKEEIMARGASPEMADTLNDQINALELAGFPVIDAICWLDLDNPKQRTARYMELIDGLKPGITHLLLHPAASSPELKAIAPDASCRVADLEVFTNAAIQEHISASGIHVIGYRDLRKVMRI